MKNASSLTVSGGGTPFEKISNDMNVLSGGKEKSSNTFGETLTTIGNTIGGVFDSATESKKAAIEESAAETERLKAETALQTAKNEEPKDNTVLYVIFGIVALATIITLAVVLSKKKTPAPIINVKK
jgi:hypothetical protein